MTRDEILRKFEALLDAALAGEDAPAGIPSGIIAAIESAAIPGALESNETDLYALWSATTALTQEVKLQGRAFRDLSDSIAAKQREVERDAERRTRRNILAALIDLRERLLRGRDSAAPTRNRFEQPPQAGIFQRLFAKPEPDRAAVEAVDALIKGYVLGVERLDQMLEEFGAREIQCKGMPFDAHRMNAVDTEDTDSAPEGTVLEVYRSGYEWEGEVYQTAQVKVSRKTGSPETGQQR
jgi:molecular chaperone GrpE